MKYFPHVVENFITDEENDLFLKFSSECNQAFDDSTKSIIHGRWKSRVAYHHRTQKYDQTVASTMLEVTGRIHDYLKEIQPAVNIYTEVIQFSRWQVGDHLIPPHIDNLEHDGRDNATPWRHYGFVLYLNDNFTGGELFYPNYNLTIKPKPKMLAVHTAGPDCIHGVREIERGTRHTLIGFAGLTKSHFEMNPSAYYQGEK